MGGKRYRGFEIHDTIKNISFCVPLHDYSACGGFGMRAVKTPSPPDQHKSAPVSRVGQFFLTDEIEFRFP